ncbi:MAG: site-2 protease family protein [Nocardioidaceae bacterium]
MNALLYTLGVVVFAVGVLVSIALHEVGHMYPAKRFGVKVTQYFVGFGRTVWSTRRGETEYGIKAFPLGGFVKLVGMLPPEPGGDPTRVRKSNTGLFTQLVADARTAEYENVRPDEQDRLFYRKPWWQKLVVMTGGPLVNLVIALFLFAVVFMGIGAPMATHHHRDRLRLRDQRRRSRRGSYLHRGRSRDAGEGAGLQPGDTISSFNGQQVTGWPQLTQMIRANGDREATIGLQRDGVAVTETVNTSVLARVSLSDPDRTERVGFLGVTPTVGYVRQGPGFVLSTMGSYTKATGVAIIDLPQRMVAVTKAAFGGVREQDGPMSVVGASRVAGEMVTADETTWTDRVYRILSLIAAVNLFVALFNFIPLLPLDGGHIVGALWEGLRRGWARVAGRPDPGYVDVGKMLPVAYAVGALLLVMGVLLIYADIVNPVRFS